MQNFASWMTTALTFSELAYGKSLDFWTGYMRGLRRLHHGQAFSTEEEHGLFLNIPEDDPDPTRRATGEGYRAGFAGIDPAELIKEPRKDRQ